MKIFVLSLLNSVERRENVSTLLNEHQLNFEFIDGIDGRKADPHLLDLYNEKKFTYNYGRKAVLGELGCYASHKLAWKKCIELNEPIIIFEDDFCLKEGVVQALSECEKLIDDYHFIRLEDSNKKPQYKIKSINGMTLLNYLKVPQCTTCYAISPIAAKKLLHKSQEIILPVDVFIRNVWMHQQPIFSLEPFYVTPGTDISIIGKRKRKQKKSLATRLMCIGYKVRNIVFNLYTQGLFFLQNKLR
ncbi:glycosyltransferase family 25 protein [Photobacterium profundum]|uniref:glycosyltransferase family 25 protein n=1 Tax=Photobacterium profundum TaxID=74109 RepID=UPI003D10162D